MAFPATNNSQAFVSTMDLYEPEFTSDIVKAYPKEYDSFQGFWQMFGRDKAVADETVSHFEMGRTWSNIGVAINVGAPGAGNPITWQIPTNQHYDSGTLSYPRVGDTVLFNNGVYGRITVVDTTTPNAHEVTVEPYNTTDAIPALTAGTSFVVEYSNAMDEGTDQPAGRTIMVDQYTFGFQIVKDTYVTTGTELGTKVRIDNQNFTFYNDKVTTDHMNMQLDLAYLVSPGTATSYNTGFGTSRIMQGLLPWAETGGNYTTYVPGTWAISDLDTAIDNLDAARQGTDYVLCMSRPLYREIETAFQSAYGAGAIRYADYLGKNSIKLPTNIGQIDRSGYTFGLKYFNIFTDPQSLGSTGFKYLNYGVGIPMGSTADAFKGTVPLFELCYRKFQGYNRKFKIWETGANASTPTNSIDNLQVNYTAEVAAHPKVAQSFFGFQP